MRIVGGFDQLHVHPHRVAALLHAAFQDVRHAKLAGDLGQVFRRALVMLGRGARDHLQIGDLRQAGQDFVLDAVGKVGVLLVAAQVLERQDRDAIFPAPRRVADASVSAG